MSTLSEKINYFSESYQKIKEDKTSDIGSLQANSYFLSDRSILNIPRDDGDNRFPYGVDGFNFWTYASGYMHANEGLFSPFLRATEGQEPNIAFFAGKANPDNTDEFDVLPLLAVPQHKENSFGAAERYTIFDTTATYYICETKDYIFAVRVFIEDSNKMNFTITAETKSEDADDIYLSWYFNPILNYSITDNSENRWFREVSFEENADLGSFIFKVNEDLNRYRSVTNYAVLNQKFTSDEAKVSKVDASTSRYQYVGGSYSSLHNARALRNGGFGKSEHVTAFTETATAGEIVFVEFAGKAKLRIDINLDYIIHSDEFDAYESLLLTPNIDELEKKIEAKYLENSSKESALEISFKDSEYEDIDAEILTDFTLYLKKQVEFCATIKGFIQLSMGSLIGIRDVFQALEAVLFYEPKLARAKMLEGLEFIDPSGRAPRQYSLPSESGGAPIMDLRPFIDQGHWVIDTFITYLKYTDDFSILEEQIPYWEIIDEKAKLVSKTDYTDTVLEHLLAIMNFLISNIDEDTKCLKALFGDWNDALDGLGVSKDTNKEYGNGVSVMSSLQLHRNLLEMIELLNYLGVHENIQAQYKEVKEELVQGLIEHAVQSNEAGEKRIVHGWGEDQDYFVGGFNDPDGESRYGLTSAAFWVIGRLYEQTPELHDVLLDTFKNLRTKYGMKTFDPGFEPGTNGVGRIHKLPIGTAENGAVYIHGSAFAVATLFAMGESELAWEELIKLLPFTHEKVSVSPYVMPNSYGYSPELNIDGESMLDWQTGSSNVILKIILYYVFGIRFEYDGIRIQSASHRPFSDMSLSMSYMGKRLNIQLEKDASTNRKFLVNGQKLVGTFDDAYKIEVLNISKDDMQELEEIDITVIN